MRIALVSPLYESVPPQGYGGTERVVSYLAEDLVRRGHDVTLYASADSRTSARLVPCCPRSLRLDPDCQDDFAHHVVQLEKVLCDADWFDVVHWHIDHLHLPLARRLRVPSITTMHGRLDIPDLVPLFAEFHDAPLVSISDAQRAPLPAANWVRTIHHGLPADLYRTGPGDGGYLAFLGRLSREKRVDRAIRIAVEAGMPLKIAAKLDEKDRAWFDDEVVPLLDHPLVELVGEIGEDRKQAFLGSARALLFPIDWPEPFGLVMIEALACGTPVVAWREGSVPEILEDGVTGFVVDHPEAAVDAVRRLGELSRQECRDRFEQRFTVERMVDDHEALYASLVQAPGLTAPVALT